MDFKKLTTKEKALRINLDARIYGSFAEIGAGQDVAANFFKAGGASGTVAKTMSAYDMAFSDAIYGPEISGRYVCEPRLHKMLDKEYNLLVKRLQKRAAESCFFAFANTVEALNYQRTNEGRGWIGLKFQLTPESEPNECVIHCRMKDNENLLQQQALGVIGVNLAYGCYYYHNDPEKLLNSLLDDLSRVRIEVDFFRLTGPDFLDLDNRLMSLKLVTNGLTDATMFGPDGQVLQPADCLYKKNPLILRGRFRPITHVNLDMFASGYELFKKEAEVDEDNIMVMSELNLDNLITQKGEIDAKDFLDRVDILCSLGQYVLISGYKEYYKLISYLSRLTRNRKIGMILGVNNLQSIFNEKYYNEEQGGILQSFGEMFSKNIKLYIYPSLRGKGEKNLITCDNIQLPSHLEHLFRYLTDNNKIADIKQVEEHNLHIIADEVLKMIKSGKSGWEDLVPDTVADIIKDKCLFDYPCDLLGRVRKDDKVKTTAS
ncbi:TonB-dependent receptor [Rapidithrix thailandica]|uniref:TonB-dependent receptor n=1 Tax=Rapidithrix thailandica TaxID=413964 RepID=A0AAW9S4N2_9BACT